MFPRWLQARKKEPETLSALVRHMDEALPKDESLTVDHVFGFLGLHGLVFFLLVLALLNIAIFMLPGFSILFGLPMVIFSVQMLLGLEKPVIPAFLREKKIKGKRFHQGMEAAVRFLERIEPAIKPRLLPLTEGPIARRVHSLAALALSFMVAIPVPFFNLPPTFGIICLSIGLLQRDGFFIIGGYAFALWSFWLYESLSSVAQGLF